MYNRNTKLSSSSLGPDHLLFEAGSTFNLYFIMLRIFFIGLVFLTFR